MSNADGSSAGFFVCCTAVALRQSPSTYNNALMLLRLHSPPLSNVDFLMAHGVSCMLQVVSSQSYNMLLLQQLVAVSVLIACGEILARLTGPV